MRIGMIYLNVSDDGGKINLTIILDTFHHLEFLQALLETRPVSDIRYKGGNVGFFVMRRINY